MLAAGLARRGHDVAVAVLYAGGALDVARRRRRAPCSDREGEPLARHRPARAAAAAFVTERPDLVYAFQPTQTTLAALLLPPCSDAARLRSAGRGHGGRPLRYVSASPTARGLAVATADLVIANARTVRADAIKRGMAADASGRPQRHRHRGDAARCGGRAGAASIWGIADDGSSSAAWRGSTR